MDLQSRLALSYYNEVATLNAEHHISIVQHRSSHRIFVKKELSVYNIRVYRYILEHPIPNIPKIYEMYEEDGILTVIEEYISGSTLSEYLEQNGALSLEEAADYFIKICQVVSSLHHCLTPIIHRDIKPSNLILTESQEIYLLDINAAKYVSNLTSQDTTLLGTHGYAAPEQYGFGRSDQHTDIYALGILFTQMLTGNPGRKPDASNPFSDIIRKCTQMEASRRYDCVEDLMKDVKKKMGLACSDFYCPYLPPGFRSGNLSHIFAALPIYPLLIFLAYTLEIEGISPAFARAERIIVAAGMFLMIAFTWNYCNIQHYVPFLRNKNSFFRFFMILLVDFIIFCLVTVVTAIGESIFHI